MVAEQLKQELEQKQQSVQEFVSWTLTALTESQVKKLSPSSKRLFETLKTPAANVEDVIQNQQKAIREYVAEVENILFAPVKTVQENTRKNLSGFPFNLDETWQDILGTSFSLNALGDAVNPAANQAFRDSVAEYSASKFKRVEMQADRREELERTNNFSYLHYEDMATIARNNLQNLSAKKRDYLEFLQANDNYSQEDYARIQALESEIRELEASSHEETPENNVTAAEEKIKEAGEKKDVSGDELLTTILGAIPEEHKDAQEAAVQKVVIEFNVLNGDKEKTPDKIIADLKKIDGIKDLGDGFLNEALAKKFIAYYWAKKRDEAHAANRAVQDAENQKRASLKKKQDELRELEDKKSTGFRRILHEQDTGFQSLSYVDQRTFISRKLSAINEEIKIEEEKLQAAVDGMNHEQFCIDNPILGKITNFTRSAVDNVLSPVWKEAGKPFLSWSGEKGADALAWTVSKGVPGVVKWWGERHQRKVDKLGKKVEQEQKKTEIKTERQKRFGMSLVGRALKGVGSIGMGVTRTAWDVVKLPFETAREAAKVPVLAGALAFDAVGTVLKNDFKSRDKINFKAPSVFQTKGEVDPSKAANNNGAEPESKTG